MLRDRLAPPDEYDKDKGVLADCTYDLTMAKYSNFPDQTDSKLNSGDYSFKGTGIDCRNYYRAFLHIIKQERDEWDSIKNFVQEYHAGAIFKGLILRNFLFSRKDCKRVSPFSKRYQWKVKSTRFYLWRPSYMEAKEFRGWLEENINDVNPKNPNEKNRIQSKIDTSFPRGHNVFIDDPYNPIELDNEIRDEFFSAELKESQVFVDSLGKEVAQKKVEEIHELRPGIAKLGEETVEHMISQIFSDLSEADYSVTRIAEQYGISKPTLSRFAGSKWFEKIEDSEKVDDIKKVVIPDLWKNTAEILSGSPEFMEKVLASGFAGILKNVIDIIKPKKGEAHE